MAVPLGKTKHFQLAQQLCRDIRKMPAGTPLPTIEELKIRFGASQVTIDKAILRLKRDGLIRRPDGRKRLIVADVPDKAQKRVAIIRPDYPSIVFEEIARGLVLAGRKKDWAFDLVHYRDLEKFDLALAMEDSDAAVLMLNPQPISPRLLKELRHPRKPVVVAQDLLVDEPEIPSVCSDDRRVTEMLTEHLLALGHRRIGLITATLKSGPMRAALQGWRDALAAAGITDCEELMFNADVPPYEYSLPWIYRQFSGWLDRSPPPFTAMIGAATDTTLAGMRALREHGRTIPGDVSFVSSSGFTEFAEYLEPPLTSMVYNMSIYGEELVKHLDETTPQEARTQKSLIQPIIRLGRSTAAPKS